MTTKIRFSKKRHQALMHSWPWAIFIVGFVLALPRLVEAQGEKIGFAYPVQAVVSARFADPAHDIVILTTQTSYPTSCYDGTKTLGSVDRGGQRIWLLHQVQVRDEICARVIKKQISEAKILVSGTGVYDVLDQATGKKLVTLEVTDDAVTLRP